jgi:hypothetical protein
MPILKKQDILLESLKKFYSSQTNLNKLLNVLSKDSTVSLRAIDYLCTNYAKTQDVLYDIGKIPFNLYLSYRSQLKAYSKMQFDPFRRHERIFLNVPNGQPLETTVAQLNFFKWAIEKKVIDWYKSNSTKIEKEMIEQGSKKTKKKSSELQKHAKRHNVHITVTFS